MLLKYGVCLDLIGSVGLGDLPPSLLEKFLRPFGNSTNILITSDGKVALIDPHLSQENWPKQLAKFVAFEIEYWRLVSQDMRDNLRERLKPPMELVPA